MGAAGREGRVTRLAAGFFDGVHCGHAKILSGADGALTFRNHPLSVVAPSRAPALLMSPAARISAIGAALGGKEKVFVLDFTESFASWAPERFITYLKRRFPALETVRCGPNWTYGAGGKGTPAMLRAAGLRVERVPFARRGGEPVSSTRIRAALGKGDLRAAAAMLGRPYCVSGRIVPGKGLGRRLGFPTLNAVPEVPSPLARGVYAVETAYGPGVANFGVAPTMGGRAWKEPVFEVHLLSSPPRRMRRAMEIRPVSFLRAERRFDSKEELAAQLRADVARAGAVLRKKVAQ